MFVKFSVPCFGQFWALHAGVYILFENSYTFHNFSLNLPPSKKNFALRANFSWHFYKCFTFLGEKTKFPGQRLKVERFKGWMLGRLEGLKVERQEKTSER